MKDEKLARSADALEPGNVLIRRIARRETLNIYQRPCWKCGPAFEKPLWTMSLGHRRSKQLTSPTAERGKLCIKIDEPHSPSKSC